MPLYEFKCRTCGRTFEDLIRNASDEAAAACPTCGTKDVQRLLSTTALGFVGVSGGGAVSTGGGGGGGCGGGHGGFT